MKKELRSEVVMPTRADTTRVVAVGVGCALLGAGIVMLAIEPPGVPVTAAPPSPSACAPVEPAAAPTPAIVAPAPVTALDPRASELGFVFSAGGVSYVKLVGIATTEHAEGEIMPRHGAVELHEGEDARRAAVAPVSDADVPLAHRAWRQREVVVDGTCKAKVTGFALVARLAGDPGYAGITDGKWTAANVFAHGKPVLAARLDGCGDGTFARDAALSAVVVPESIENEELASAAKQKLILSAPARETQTAWIEGGREGLWYMQSTVSTQVVRHPQTGATWVSVYGHAEHECGGPSVNLWGLFRVGEGGALHAVQLRKLGELESIEKLVDIEGDGQLELIGRPWLGLDLVATRADGTELARLATEFYGCPC